MLNIKRLPLIAILPLIILGFIVISINTNVIPVHAAATIVVNSTADDQDNDGECTLREAIIASNTDTTSGAAVGECEAGSGSDTINFNITGTADFTNGGQDGYTISPTSALPNITETVNINGYSQPGAQANTANAPNPFNGTLLIELDGTNAGGSIDGFNILASSTGTVIRGLVINSFDGRGVGGSGGGSNTVIKGNYIGTDPSGLVDKGNGDLAIQLGANTLIGGLDPEDRNLISGNEGGGISPNTDDNNYTIQGNYIGVDATGLVGMANSLYGGNGALSLDNSSGHVIGGPEPSAINVISGNNYLGIAPHNCDDVTIQNNYIGVGYDGTTPIGNQASGISFTDSSNVSIKDNIIKYNGENGVNIATSTNATIIGNEIIGNVVGSGVFISDSSNNTIGGKTDTDRNVISDNGGSSNVFIVGFGSPSDSNVVQGNYIGTDVNGDYNPSFSRNNGVAIFANANNNVIGGNDDGAGNLIAYNGGGGVVTGTLTMTGFGEASPQNVSIISNEILATNSGSIYSLSLPGLGIDLMGVTMDGGFTPQYTTNEGSTPNDASDLDTGPNNYLNFPVINSTSATTGNLDVNFDLDVDDTATGYRVEFFANDTADPSGYGEGQYYLGSKDVAASTTGEVASLSIPTSFTSGEYAITATTTEKDTSTDGFGSTSEFSAVLGDQTVIAATASTTITNTEDTNPGSLADTGQDLRLMTIVGILLLSSSLLAIRMSSYAPIHTHHKR